MMKGKKIVIPALVLSLVGGAGILATLNQSLAPVSNTSKTATQVSSTETSSVAKSKESSTEKTPTSRSEQSSPSSTSSPNSQSESSGAVTESSKAATSSEQGATETTTAEQSKSNPPISQETINKLANSQSQAGQKHILNVSPQIQRAWNTCAPTTVSMMLSYRGIEVSQEVLAQEMGTDTTFGTHNANAIQVLNRYLFGYDFPQANQAGYRLETVTTADVHSDQMRLFKQRLKQNIADGYPMYYTFDCAKIYPGSKGEHNVIGIGYQLTDDGSDVAYLYYLDPSYTKQDPVYGGLKKITPQELFEGMLTCVEPNYGW